MILLIQGPENRQIHRDTNRGYPGVGWVGVNCSTDTVPVEQLNPTHPPPGWVGVNCSTGTVSVSDDEKFWS